MQRWHRVTSVLAAAGMTLLASTATFADPVAALDGCIHTLDAERDIGYARISARCPQLAGELRAGGIEPWLPSGWRDPNNDLSAGSLAELRDALAAEQARPVLRAAPSTRTLPRILDRLTSPVISTGGWWSRFRQWLRRVMEPREEPPEASWLSRLRVRLGLTQGAWQIIGYGTLCAIIALALVIVGNELKAAGLLRRASATASNESAGGTGGAAGVESALLERAPLEERPGLLLKLLLARLGARRVFGGLGALTTRQILATVRIGTAEQGAAQLTRLAGTAERVRYASTAVRQEELESAIDAGRALLGQIEAGAVRGLGS